MDPRIEAVRKIIENEYRTNLKVPELARRAGISRSYLASLFKTETGLTIKGCLREIRLNTAAKILSHGAASVKDVSLSVGYSHAANFSREFKSHFGSPPSEYRVQFLSSPLPGPQITPMSQIARASGPLPNASA